MRPNRATVSDSGLGAAFTEGVNEGLRLTGHVLLICKVGSRDKFREIVKASDVPELIGNFVATLRGEHYEVGVTIRIISEGDVAQDKAQARVVDRPELGESGIEEAELVD